MDLSVRTFPCGPLGMDDVFDFQGVLNWWDMQHPTSMRNGAITALHPLNLLLINCHLDGCTPGIDGLVRAHGLWTGYS